MVVSYERAGNTASEPVFFELETQDLKSGLKQIEVTVTDLNTGRTASKRALFRVVAPPPSEDAGNRVPDMATEAPPKNAEGSSK